VHQNDQLIVIKRPSIIVSGGEIIVQDPEKILAVLRKFKAKYIGKF